MDIKSLSVVEAEFIYDRVDDHHPSPRSPQTTGNTNNNNNNNNNSNQDPSSPNKKLINLDSFHIIKVIGKGSFGKVFLVREKATRTLFAMKVLKKDHIIRKNQVEHTKTERSVLGNKNYNIFFLFFYYKYYI